MTEDEKDRNNNRFFEDGEGLIFSKHVLTDEDRKAGEELSKKITKARVKKSKNEV